MMAGANKLEIPDRALTIQIESQVNTPLDTQLGRENDDEELPKTKSMASEMIKFEEFVPQPTPTITR